MPLFEEHLTGPTAEALAVRRAAFTASWPRWQPRTLAGHAEHGARLWPDRPRFVSDGVTWTYADVAEQTSRAAAAFHAAGIRRGDRVALMMRNCAEFYCLKFALTRLGALAVPLNYLLAPGELAYILGDSEPALVVLDARILDRDMVGVLDEALSTSGRDRPAIVVRGDEDDAFDSFLAGGAGVEAPDAGRPEDFSEIMYTSGSTGVPKGVVLANDALLREAYGTACTRAFDGDWRSLTALPPFHLFGFAQAVLPPSFAGGCVHLQPRFDARAQLGLVADGSVNDLVGVLAMFYRMFDVLDTERFDLSGLRSAYIGGDAVPEAEWQRLREEFGIDEITSGFGMTELQGTSFMVPPGATNEQLANSIGWESFAGCAGMPELGGAQHEWRLVDVQTGEPVRRGQVGELHYRGPSVSPNYWRIDPADDSSRTGGWFRSGDLAWQRDDDALVFAGRNSETYRSGGELVTPREVEAVIAQLEGVGATYVVGVPDRRWGQVGCAWILSSGDSPPSAQEVVAYCRERLAPYKIPKHVLYIKDDELPISGTGKLRKRGLVEMAVERLS